MDLGLKGRRAIVCAASQGLGKASAMALAQEGVDLFIAARHARTGLTGFIAGLARSVAEHNVTVNNLLPGTFDTDRLKSNLAALAKNSSRSVAEVTEEIRTANPTKRFGHPDDSAQPVLFCARCRPATSQDRIF